MNHIWKDSTKINQELIFVYTLKGNETRLELSASNFYSVFYDDVFKFYGPERTQSGYSRVRVKEIEKGVKKITFKVLYYGFDSFDCDLEEPYIGVDFYDEFNNLVGNTFDLIAYESTIKDLPTTKFSFQRGLVERFNLKNINISKVATKQVKSPILLNENPDPCYYIEQEFIYDGVKPFEGFIKANKFDYEGLDVDSALINNDVVNDFYENIKNGFNAYDYHLDEEKTGLLKFKIISLYNDAKVYVVFDENIKNGWHFGRNSCIDLITIDCDMGEYSIQTSSPYALKYLKILSNKEIDIYPTIIRIENNTTNNYQTGDEKIDKIISAARNTFNQNAYDLFTDCPGRERAGWLCDSYFEGIAEEFFTGKRSIEKHFLENFVYAKCPEIDKYMLPMCFPSNHRDHNYIPNWAMWYVIELRQYFESTGDSELINKAKKKVYDLVKYFRNFENEYKLLENLKKWVFVEWSVAGSKEYVQGVNFPTNMLYSKFLLDIGVLYNDIDLIQKSKVVKSNILKLSYNGTYFIDNALRVDKKLVAVKDHISETCQYYALFFDVVPSKEFTQRIIKNFGVFRKENAHKEVGRSEAFIGFFLRYFVLFKEKEYKRLLKETIEYFSPMANETGTLWENTHATASCNHGFSGSIAALIYKSNLRVIADQSQQNDKTIEES